jgi:taurine dioxygenase
MVSPATTVPAFHSVRALSKDFAAEVFAPPFREWPTRSDLLDLLEEHLVLVFRGQQDMTLEEQVELTKLFGPVGDCWDIHHRHPEDNRVQIISNANRQGLTFKSSTLYWHSDQSFCKFPSPVTLLRVVDLPSWGGNTVFANLRSAFEDLPAEAKSYYRTLRTIHSFSHLMAPLMDRRQGSGSSAPLRPLYPDVHHPLVVRHRRTNRESLYLSELCVSAVEGLPSKDGVVLLDHLHRHAVQDKYVYSHAWRLGDVVAWFNPGLLHRADSIPTTEPRTFFRTNTYTERPLESCC